MAINAKGRSDMRSNMEMLLRVAAVLVSFTGILWPAVHRIQILNRAPVEGGMAFGAAGPYERITATVSFTVDPKATANRAIVDLDRAPTNAEGQVEFTADLLIFRPKDPKKANGTVLIDVPNRGRPLVVSTFNAPGGAYGDGFLFDRGFTIAVVGWQWDTPDVEGRIKLRAPKLPANITGLVRGEFVTDAPVKRFSLGDRDQIPYPVADEKDRANRLYVSDAPGAERRLIPRDKWRFVDKTSVELDEPCAPGKVYEVIYKATGAVPVGVGFAAIRDMAAFFKYGEGPLVEGEEAQPARTLAFGVSQTGRFLRHMMYQGFNTDEKGRRALDGVWAHVAGAGRGGFNHRFAQPSRDGQALLHYSWPVDLFPFADGEQRDPHTGKSDALLKRVKELRVAPKIMYTNNSYEYWGRAASLIHTTSDGSQDLPPDENTRIYFVAGGQHGAGALPLKKTVTQNLENPLDYRWALRSLLVAFDAWLRDGSEPPPSMYPKLSAGELVAPADVKYRDSIQAPQWPRIPNLLNLGTTFLSKGIVTNEPPREGAAYKILVAQVDADGNEVGGVKLPELMVPLGSYSGWNLRTAAIGNPERMTAFTGSFFPFSQAEIRKRYQDKQHYLERFRQACADAAAKRVVLAGDTEKMTANASQLWDELEKRAN